MSVTGTERWRDFSERLERRLHDIKIHLPRDDRSLLLDLEVVYSHCDELPNLLEHLISDSSEVGRDEFSNRLSDVAAALGFLLSTINDVTPYIDRLMGESCGPEKGADDSGAVS